MVLQIEYEFTLPKGYADESGALHKSGIMRLASAADEILPQKDPRVTRNPAYLSIIVLSRVISKLGDLTDINPGIIEKLFVADLSYLQEFYRRINGDGTLTVKTKCPKCSEEFAAELEAQGE